MTSPQKLHMAKCQTLSQSLGKLSAGEKQKTVDLKEKQSIITERIQGLSTYSLPLEITNFIWEGPTSSVGRACAALTQVHPGRTLVPDQSS